MNMFETPKLTAMAFGKIPLACMPSCVVWVARTTTLAHAGELQPTSVLPVFFVAMER